jgi:hypothetical protein
MNCSNCGNPMVLGLVKDALACNCNVRLNQQQSVSVKVTIPNTDHSSINPLVRRDTTDAAPYRRVVARNRFIPYPESWPPYVNGTGEPCDMLQGPCCCGAWHDLNEWEVDETNSKQV